jgi:hypothetical protein
MGGQTLVGDLTDSQQMDLEQSEGAGTDNGRTVFTCTRVVGTENFHEKL